jgi:nucleotide-binding universal stress UspA family protein
MDARTVSDVSQIVQEVLGDIPASMRVEALRGEPTAALLDTLAPDSVLCLGSRGLGRVKGMLLGSVSRTCIEYAVCPVVIARDSDAHDTDGGEILVGVDGSDRAMLALDWALSLGELTGTHVAAVHVWQTTSSEVRPRLQERLQAEARAAITNRLGDRDLELIDVEGDPRQKLVEMAAQRKAKLVVVGRRGSSRLVGISVGGVTSFLVANSPTTIAVIPPP